MLPPPLQSPCAVMFENPYPMSRLFWVSPRPELYGVPSRSPDMEILSSTTHQSVAVILAGKAFLYGPNPPYDDIGTCITTGTSCTPLSMHACMLLCVCQQGLPSPAWESTSCILPSCCKPLLVGITSAVRETPYLPSRMGELYAALFHPPCPSPSSSQPLLKLVLLGHSFGLYPSVP